MSRRRQWTINGRFLAQSVTGVQRYGREIVQALDAHLEEGHPLAQDLSLDLLVPRTAGSAPALRHIRVRKTTRLAGHLWEQLILPFSARGGILSLCNTSTVFPRKQIVCVHDLNTRRFPGSYSPAFRCLYFLLIPAVLKSAAAVATVSEHSAGELTQHNLARRDRIRVIPDGHEHVGDWPAPPIGTKQSSVDDSTIVVIGSPAPHKNIGLILELAPQLAQHGMKIAVLGRLDRKVFRSAGAAAEAKNIIWAGAVSDSELRLCYENALCLAFPSIAEGFGLPPLEAMALGCPVVCSNCASLPEVCGDAVLYAPPSDKNAWMNAFLKLRADRKLRSALSRRGEARAEKFTWRRSAEQYLELMGALDGLGNLHNGLREAKLAAEITI